MMASESLIGRTIGSYHILEQVGRGGMTVVYRAIHVGRRETVALKVLSPYIAHDAMFQARFRRETRLLQGLHHPNIVPILDFGELDSTLFIVMPLLSGGTLQDRLARQPLTPKEAMRFMAQVSSALQHAHAAGIVHRDVKPSNVLIDEKGNALLSDFGFAQVSDSSLSLTGSALIGTPSFMSPEQCQGGEVTPQSDQYSLGIVLYHIATGRLPFESDTPMGAVIKQVNEPLPRPRYYSPNLPNAVEAILVKALAKDPAHRFSSIGAFNDAFQEAMQAAMTLSGNLKMRSGVAKRPSQYFPDMMPSKGFLRRSRFWTGRRVAAGALLLLMLLPITAWALSTLLPADAGAVSILVTPTGFDATEWAVKTALAAAGGPASSGDFETAVAATIAAIGLAPPGSHSPTGGPGTPLSGSPTSNAGGIVPTSTWTPSGSGAPTETSLPATPVPSAVPTATAPAPSATSAPATPTRTPTPVQIINPNACKTDPDHQNYCSPTP